MTEQKVKKRKVLRNNEYYGQQEKLDELYKNSKRGFLISGKLKLLKMITHNQVQKLELLKLQILNHAI